MEIMAPAGNFESLYAAIKANADSIYFGVENLNMRSNSSNFKLKDLKKIAFICKKNKIKTYLTLNTIIYDSDIDLLKKICDLAKKFNITAIIACDVAVMQYAKSINLEVHSSTQLNISNLEAVKFYSKFVDVIVLARELTLPQIEYICKKIKELKITGPSGNLIKIELFCHGALCVSISGKCYMSLSTFNSSANRGACLQNCRRSYRVIDDQTNQELVIDNKYVMSPKDLCTIQFLDKLDLVGVSVLKIEGRARPPEYVYTVTKVYKEAINAIKNKTYTKQKINSWIEQLSTVYNRGFWHGGYYLGKELDSWSGIYGPNSTKVKKFIGIVTNYFSKKKIASILLQTNEVKKLQNLIIIGPTTGILNIDLKKIFIDDKEVNLAKKGDVFTIEIPEKVRKNDKVYLWIDRK